MTSANDNSLRSLWRQDSDTLEPLPLAEVKSRATAFNRAIGKRNRREYVAVAFVALIFGLYVVILPDILLKIGSLFVIAGGFVMARQLSRQTSQPDPGAEAADVHAYYRARLVTEERMLARVGLWYIGPLVPGLVVFIAGLAGQFDSALGFAAFAAIPVLAILGAWLLNRRAAAMLREQIARLDVATEGQ